MNSNEPLVLGGVYKIRKDLKCGQYGDECVTRGMLDFKGQTVTIKESIDYRSNVYLVKENSWCWTPEMLEGPVDVNTVEADTGLNVADAEKIDTAIKAEKSTVNHPEYYKTGGLEAIDVIEAWGLGFCLGNAVKYISRAGKKNPDKEIEDLEKAAWYINHQIEVLTKRKKDLDMEQLRHAFVVKEFEDN